MLDMVDVEYIRKLNLVQHRSVREIARRLGLSRNTVTKYPLPQPVCDDPSDDKFLSTAMETRAKIIVSGDKHLLKVSGYQGLTVLTPRQFVTRCLSID